MRGFCLVIVVCLAVQLATATREKPGICRNRAKREQCQCAPHGNDDCSDECADDYDCNGNRKCCTNICRRVCSPTVYRPTFSCPPGENPNPCPPPNEPRCPTPIPVPPPPRNETECVPKCTCRPGYVRREDGKCVKRIECPPAPPPSKPFCPGIHEIYHDCYQGCQGSCANPSAEGCIVNNCVRGCFCAPGFVRNGHGRCIRLQSCPPPTLPPGQIFKPIPPATPRCPDNQEFSACRRECEATCINPKPRGCFRRCQAGCFCQSPYVRDHYGHCILPAQCVIATTVAPACGLYEEYRFCSTKCQGTCENQNADGCYARCQTGCFCIDGYVRDKDGRCISASDCPKIDVFVFPPPPPGIPVCENDLEVYIECHRGCQRTCDNPSGQGCSETECVSGCYCQDGYVRNHLGQCVQQHACIGCGYHEHWEECGPSCPPVCNYTNSGDCDNQCHTGCYCDEGYIRRGGSCVPINHCQNQYQCASYEDPVPCGQVCEQACTNGWSNRSCPSACRNRCCRRRFLR